MNPVSPPAYMVGPADRSRAIHAAVERTGSSTDEQRR